MADQFDFELRQADEQGEPLSVRRSKRPLWIGVAVLIVTAAVAVYFFGLRERSPSPAENATSANPPPAPAQPLGAEPAAIDVPPLDESDALVRDLVRELSAHPRVAAWLATDGLIRNFTVIVENIADGMTPVTHLTRLRPPDRFAIVEQGEDLAIDPRSYRRYDAFADGFASLDVPGSARLYATLKPRIEEAYRELGGPEGSFDRTLERAIVRLLETPAAGESPRVEPHGIGYRFADPALESLTAPQKHLLRMGPRNVRLVQAKLHQLALALGIPAERLPAR